MSRRLLSACLGAAVLVGGWVRAGEPEDNPPLGGGAIVQPAAPERFVAVELKTIPGTLANEEMPFAHPLLTLSRQDIEMPVAWSGAPIETMEPTLRQKWAALRSAAEETISAIPSIYASLPASLPTPTLYQLRPTARRTLAGSLLSGVNPALAFLPTEKVLDAPCDHPQQVAGDDVLSDMPELERAARSLSTDDLAKERSRRRGDWLQWLLSHWPIQRNVPGPEQNEGYVHSILPNTLVARLMPGDEAEEKFDAPLVPTLEMLPMPQEDGETPDGFTCPWMRQQAVDRHACQFADPQIGRSVLENFERLEEADLLLGMAKEFARAGCIGEALEYCAFAQDLCPGSPCAARAAEVMCDLYVRLCEPETKPEPGIEQQVKGLMKACRLLMNAGWHEQAAELARQAFALDPERVAADPLIYKMHLLAVTPASHSAGSEEASEPPSCPYCPPAGKPIREIVPAKKKSKSDPATSSVPSGSEEASEEFGPSSLGELVEAMMGGPGRAQFGFGFNGDGSLRLCGEATYFGTVYHLLFSRGALAIWKTPDAAAVQP